MKALHSQWSSFLCVTIFAVIACLSFGINDLVFMLMLVAMGWFFCGKIFMAFFLMRGHALFAVSRLKGKAGPDYWAIRMFKMPFKNAVIFGILLIPALALMYLAYAADMAELGRRTISNMRAFSWIAIFSVFAAFAHYAFFWRDYYFGSEYDARKEFQVMGDAPEIAEAKIRKLKAMGVFGSAQ